MGKVIFTKESISPVVYYGRITGVQRLFAIIRKAKGDTEYSVEIDGTPGTFKSSTLAEAKELVIAEAKANHD